MTAPQSRDWGVFPYLGGKINRMRIPDDYASLFWWTHSQTPPARYFVFEGGRSSGKTTTICQSLVLRGAVQPIRVLCAREFQNSINESVKKSLEDAIKFLNLDGYVITKDSIEHENGTSFVFKGLHNDPETTVKGLEGIDVCFIDEAQFISKHSLDILLPTIRKENSTVIFAMNPLTPKDEVMERFVWNANEQVESRTIHRHVTYRTALKAGLLPEEVLQQVREAKDSPDFAHIWEGKPTENILNRIMTWQQLTNAETDIVPSGGVTFGVDVARLGTDRTAVAVNQAGTLIDLVSWKHTRLTESAQTIRQLADKYNPTAINIDDCGVGGGLTDMLMADGLPVQPINSASRAKDNAKYPNVNSEMWFTFAEQIVSRNIRFLRNLPEKADLFEELSTREWKLTSKNQRQVQAKADYKAANNTGSPDLADAVLLSAYTPVKLTSWNVAVV